MYEIIPPYKNNDQRAIGGSLLSMLKEDKQLAITLSKHARRSRLYSDIFRKIDDTFYLDSGETDFAAYLDCTISALAWSVVNVVFNDRTNPAGTKMFNALDIDSIIKIADLFEEFNDGLSNLLSL